MTSTPTPALTAEWQPAARLVAATDPPETSVEVVGLREAAEILGMSRNNFNMHRKRHAGEGQCPPASAKLACGPVWIGEDVTALRAWSKRQSKRSAARRGAAARNEAAAPATEVALPTSANPATSAAAGSIDGSLQLQLFADADFDFADFAFAFADVADVADVGCVDKVAGWELADVRALAIDPDPSVRIVAAASCWNWDVRLQRVLATDPDERVVLALLDQVDPGFEVCELIIAGAHATARRELAGRNLRDELLERLAFDTDPIASATATRTLGRRYALQVVSEATSR